MSNEPVVLWAAEEEEGLASVCAVQQSPDGRSLLVADEAPMHYRGGRAFLLALDAHGSRCTMLFEREAHRFYRHSEWSRDGRWLLLGTNGSEPSWSRWSAEDSTCVWSRSPPHRERLVQRRTEANASIVDEELQYLDEVTADRGPMFGAIDDGGRLVAGCSHVTCDSEILSEAELHRVVYVWKGDEASPGMIEAGEAVEGLAFGAGGDVLAVVTRDGCVELWDPIRCARESRVTLPGKGAPTVLRARPASGLVLVGLEDGMVYAVSTRDAEIAASVSSEGPVRDLRADAEGHLVTLTWDRERILVQEHRSGLRWRWETSEGLDRFGTCALAPRGDGLIIGEPERVVRYAVDLERSGG